MRTIGSMFETHVEQFEGLDGGEVMRMFARTCDSALHTRLLGLSKAHPTSDAAAAAELGVKGCLKRREQLEPVFRAWLKK